MREKMTKLEFLNRYFFQWLFLRIGAGYNTKTKQLLFVGLMFPVIPRSGWTGRFKPAKPKIYPLWVRKSPAPSPVYPPDLLTEVPVFLPYGLGREEILSFARELAAPELELLKHQLYKNEIAYEIVDKNPVEQYERRITKVKSQLVKWRRGLNVDVHGYAHYTVKVWGYLKSAQQLCDERDAKLAKGEKWDYLRDSASNVKE
jgi:hypothetical protein